MSKVQFLFRDGLQPICVGQTVYVTNGQTGHHFRLDECVVKKIGRSLVYFKGRREPFYLATGYEKTGYARGSVYSSMDAYEHYNKEVRVIREVKAYIGDYVNALNYDQAVQIAHILGIEKSVMR
jgi:hypothetical protein